MLLKSITKFNPNASCGLELGLSTLTSNTGVVLDWTSSKSAKSVKMELYTTQGNFPISADSTT
jgi:hypothetical protein